MRGKPGFVAERKGSSLLRSIGRQNLCSPVVAKNILSKGEGVRHSKVIIGHAVIHTTGLNNRARLEWIYELRRNLQHHAGNLI